MRNICEMINQNDFDKILIQLFEHISLINGYVCLRIDLIKQQIHNLHEYIQSKTQSELDINSAAMQSVDDICEEIIKLFDRNQKKLLCIGQYVTFFDAFNIFCYHFKVIESF